MTSMECTHHERRQQRQNKTAEVFTPTWLIDDMVNTLPKATWSVNKTFLDPACGNGNILVRILQRKLDKGHDPLKALQSIYGADIMADNVKECRLRLLKVASGKAKITKAMIEAVFTNVVCVPLSRFPNGSLDYDFSFAPSRSDKTIAEWDRNIEQMLANVGADGIADVGNLNGIEHETENELTGVDWQ